MIETGHPQRGYLEVRKFRLGVDIGERTPKIILGALGKSMLGLGGEVADGVLLNYLPASHVPTSVAHIRRGGDATVYANVHVGVGDRDAAADSAATTCSLMRWSTPTPTTSAQPDSATRWQTFGPLTKRGIARRSWRL